MQRALELAGQAIGISEPNPRVGCVIVGANGQLLGSGSTQHPGGPHAEIVALRDADTRGHAIKGATAFVTLEPCSHHGRTGPCCDALVAAGVGKVVASIADPNPLVSGRGFARLRAAGVEVDVGVEAMKARELNIGFFSRMVRNKPWLRMKIAASLDGRTALDDGTSQWITSESARADGHAWRARASAVLTGIGTVLEDDPQLDVRRVECRRQPMLVIVDSRLQTPLGARLWHSERPVLIYGAVHDAQKEAALAAQGATVVLLPGAQAGGRTKVDLAAMLADLAVRECNEIHIEAGGKLNGSFIREGLVDELLVYLAPSLIGQGRPMAEFGPLVSLADSQELAFHSIERIGPDLRILARCAGRDRF
ncbi:MAG: bifunctional diaminohydroxyphosphoribosylaminopyrimidine deaminase/5-amino-6-(5-phosphoribosylamino)uracil reductase RibD [Betaproteobacteria bacterium]